MIDMPLFMKDDNMKWVDEITKFDKDGCYHTTYRAKKDAPEEIKESVRKYKRDLANHERN